MASYMGHEYTPAPATQEQGGRYRVGDRVRLTKSISCYGVSAGRIYEAIGVDEKGVATKACHFLNFDELAPAFRPGDRVKLNKHHGLRTYGDRGTVSSVLGDSVSVRMDEPSMYGSVVALFPDSVLDWERADDAKAQKYEIELPPDTDVESVFINGTLYTVDAKPKFKAGDWVRCLRDCEPGSQFTKGHYYRVKSVRDRGYSTRITVVTDDSYGENGWDADNFEVAAPCPQDNEQQKIGIAELEARVGDVIASGLGLQTRPCIVALTKNGQPRPSTYPHVHASVADATKEAERLARINPGQEFAVYQRVTARVAEVEYKMKEVA